MTSEVIDRIKARWDAEGIAIRPGNSPEVLAAFEAKYRVSLPPAFRDYFAAVDGSGDNSDGAIIQFWPLAEVMPITEYYPVEPPEFDDWFFFADFMINSHLFAIRLTPDPDGVGPVASWDGDAIQQAPSFAAFLERYLTDRDGLMLHMPPAEG